MSFRCWFTGPNKVSTPSRRNRLRLEALEDRVTPTATFDPTSGLLFIRADKAASNDTVRISALGAPGDAGQRVIVVYSLVKNGAQAFGDAAHPVK